MENEGTTISEAINAVEDAISTEAEKSVEQVEDVIEKVTEAAEDRIEAAESAAQAIADAALVTSLGERIESVRREIDTWRENHNRLEMMISSLQEKMAELDRLTAAVAALQLSTQQASLSSIQPISTQEPVDTIVEAILPNSLENDVVENPAPEMLRRPKGRWI